MKRRCEYGTAGVQIESESEIKKILPGRMERWNFHVRGILHAVQGGRRTAFRGTGVKEIEMVYVAEGRLELKIPSESFYVETGDAFVINSNVLPLMRSLRIMCKLRSLVFHPTLILGNEDSGFCKKVCTSASSVSCSRIFRLCGFPV